MLNFNAIKAGKKYIYLNNKCIRLYDSGRMNAYNRVHKRQKRVMLRLTQQLKLSEADVFCDFILKIN